MTALGSDVARTARAYNASSTYASNYEASNAFDGNGTTGWAASTNSTGQWLEVDLGSAQTISTVRVLLDGWNYGAYSFQCSDDGSTWTTLVTNNATPLDQTFGSGTLTAHRYWRVTNISTITGVFRVKTFSLYPPGTTQRVSSLALPGGIATALATKTAAHVGDHQR